MNGLTRWLILAHYAFPWRTIEQRGWPEKPFIFPPPPAP